jgi:hypothetical protein
MSYLQGSRVRDDQVKAITYLEGLVRAHKLTKHQAGSECGFSSVGKTCSRAATWTTRDGDQDAPWEGKR